MQSKDRKFYKENLWNTKDIFKNDDEFYKELESVKKSIDKYDDYKGIITKSSNNLLEFLEFDTNLSIRFDKLYGYAHLNYDVDISNNKYREMYDLVMNLFVLYSTKTSYVLPEILKCDYEIIKKYIDEEEGLKEYDRYLYLVFLNKEHILDEKSENLLSNFDKTFSSFNDIKEVLTDSELTFDDIIVDNKSVSLTESNFSNYLRHSDRTVRESAFKNIYKEYKKINNTLTQLIKNKIEVTTTLSKLRGYNNTLEKALSKDELNEKIYYKLIESVHNNINLLYEYFDVKKELLNLDEMHIYDTYAEINVKKDISFEEGKELLFKSLEVLGENYINDLKKAFDDKWIDSVNNKNKRNGAYSTSVYTVHPYVLMSYENQLEDVLTLAHELGHAMHSYYSINNQKYQNHNYSIFVAEVASQVNELLLYRYLLDNTDDGMEKLSIMDNIIQRYKSTIFRQTMFAEFELFMYKLSEEGKVITNDVLNNKYKKLNEFYFGPNVTVDDEIKYEWSRIPHFYYDYYVFKYSTGFAASVYIANKIYEKDTSIRDKYLEFLKLGSSKSPVESLKTCLVDVEDTKYIDDAFNFMKKLLDDMKKVTKK